MEQYFCSFGYITVEDLDSYFLPFHGTVSWDLGLQIKMLSAQFWGMVEESLNKNCICNSTAENESGGKWSNFIPSSLHQCHWVFTLSHIVVGDCYPIALTSLRSTRHCSEGPAWINNLACSGNTSIASFFKDLKLVTSIGWSCMLVV